MADSTLQICLIHLFKDTVLLGHMRLEALNRISVSCLLHFRQFTSASTVLRASLIIYTYIYIYMYIDICIYIYIYI